MDEIQNLIISPTFWFTSVILAFLMSFLAGYAKEWIDRWFVQCAAKKDAEARLRQSNFEAKVRKLSENPHFLSLYQTNIIYEKLRQVLYLMVAHVATILFLYSTLHFDFVPALGMLFVIALIWRHLWSATKRLAEIRAVVNAVLADDEIHFVG